MSDELHDAIEAMMTAMGAACEMSGFLFSQLLKQGFTREEAMPIVEKYLLGMLTTKGDNNGQT